MRQIFRLHRTTRHPRMPSSPAASPFALRQPRAHMWQGWGGSSAAEAPPAWWEPRVLPAQPPRAVRGCALGFALRFIFPAFDRSFELPARGHAEAFCDRPTLQGHSMRPSFS